MKVERTQFQIKKSFKINKLEVYDCIAKKILISQKTSVFESKKKREQLQIERVKNQKKVIRQK